MEYLFLVWLVFAVFGGVLASWKGRSFLHWFLGGLIIGPLVLFVIALPSTYRVIPNIRENFLCDSPKHKHQTASAVEKVVKNNGYCRSYQENNRQHQYNSPPLLETDGSEVRSPNTDLLETHTDALQIDSHEIVPYGALDTHDETKIPSTMFAKIESVVPVGEEPPTTISEPRLVRHNNKYVMFGGLQGNGFIKDAGFLWNQAKKLWETDSQFSASILAEYATDQLRESLLDFRNQFLEKMPSSDFCGGCDYVSVPDGRKLYPFQETGVRWLLNRKNALLADDMGLGKTCQGIAVINSVESISKVLVICPGSLRLNWRNEFAMWLVRPLTVAVIEPKSRWPESDIVIINFDMLHKFHDELRERTWDMLIVDEAHYCRNPSTRRAQQLFGKKWRYSETKDWQIKPIPSKRKLFMTGTPVVNRPIELWPLLDSLDPLTFASYENFAEKYCGADPLRPRKKPVGATNLDELQLLLRATVMLRRQKEEVLPELPPKITQIIELPQDSAGKAIKAEMDKYVLHQELLKKLLISKELAKTFDSESHYAETVSKLRSGATIVFRELAAERKRVALAKVPMVIEHLENSHEKIVIFAHHRDVVNALKARLGELAVSLTGENTLNDRQRAVDEFQNDPNIKYFVGSIQAAGVGITLTAARLAMFAELDWVPGNMNQASDRLHRIGQKNTVLIQHLVFNNSVDARVAKVLVSKQDVIHRALDYDVVLPFNDHPCSIGMSFKAIEKKASSITHQERENIHSALLDLEKVIDRISNEFDRIMIRWLVNRTTLSPKEAVLGQTLLSKHGTAIGFEV